MLVPFQWRKTRIAAGLAAALMAAGAMGVVATPVAAQTAPADAPAPSAAQVALAKQLLAANGEGKSFDSLIRGIIEQAAASFVQANPDLIRELRDVANSLVPQYESRRAEIDDILARAYATQFSDAELKEMLAFYNSPTGKKLVEKRQALLDQGMRGIQAWGATFAREMEGKVREEMKKRGYTI
ncbi:DUF2059 domain-containing protein [Ancylobacter sp. 6x-1]|uniref:DUF2059 domain-containing protein n=1 Tax=Ancylobacter crimeensis TaxID=2579147 RepID=A0ABT0D882_9HYPH|nr:DUF2059 domain-containing protein [Ancylobacter crimeensis]MCK0196170.1 DUF2059 domain-containing protein [Ancylobacter crimeensis]